MRLNPSTTKPNLVWVLEQDPSAQLYPAKAVCHFKLCNIEQYLTVYMFYSCLLYIFTLTVSGNLIPLKIYIDILQCTQYDSLQSK